MVEIASFGKAYGGDGIHRTVQKRVSCHSRSGEILASFFRRIFSICEQPNSSEIASVGKGIKDHPRYA